MTTAATKTIIRRERHDRFTIVANRSAEDMQLSFEALGLLTYLLSRPDNWEIRIEQLKGRGGIGKHKIRRIITELCDARYMRHDRIRDPATGAFLGTRYTVYDEPQGENRSTPVQGRSSPQSENRTMGDSPQSDFPPPADPPPENRPLYKGLTETKEGQKPNSRENAREREDAKPAGLVLLAPDDGKREEAFQLFLRPRDHGGFPPEAIDNIDRARSAWADVPEAEWTAALEALPRFLHARKTAKRGILIGLERYIRDRHWQRFPKPQRHVPDEPEKIGLAPFSRAVWALFAKNYAQRTASMAIAAQWVRRGVTVPIETKPTEAEEAALVPVAVGSSAFVAWAEHCERQGYALPKPDTAGAVYLPSEQPPPLSLAWEGYRLREIATVSYASAGWWWRVFTEGAPVAELVREARRSAGFAKIAMGPLALPRETNSMVEIHPLTPPWEAWANWFAMKGAYLEMWGSGPIWVPSEYPPAAISNVKQTEGAAA